ncbi:hypothetical protein, partial [Nonomuraea sp. NPDC049784]|uniref:hypothetical protein n=1 Tax=Nonomuraea sp. NPDC049784 TaxID=3154361 RepID=UPI0033C0ED75
LALPLAAWLGCAVTAGPLQYVQALGADRQTIVALLAGLAGGGIGAAAGAAALRHAETRLGLVSFIVMFDVLDVAHGRLDLLEPLLVLVAPAVLVAVATWRATRRGGSLGSGVLAGVAGPLLIWSVYLMIGPRLYDHTTQSGPYYWAFFMTLMALVLAPMVAGLALVLPRAPLEKTSAP